MFNELSQSFFSNDDDLVLSQEVLSAKLTRAQENIQNISNSKKGKSQQKPELTRNFRNRTTKHVGFIDDHLADKAALKRKLTLGHGVNN
jgi:hypothetical protein